MAETCVGITAETLANSDGTLCCATVSNSQMRAVLKVGLTLAGILVTVAVIHEVRHFRRYGHLAPFGLHADFSVTTSHDILAVGGTARIYEARLTNYGAFPATIVVCDYLDYASMHQTMVNYVVQRQRSSSDVWEAVPEWSEYGSRLFCRPSFEVTDTHLVRRLLWPGRSVELGRAVPAQSGFRVGDHGRFTVFPQADGNFSDSISTVSFYVGEAGP